MVQILGATQWIRDKTGINLTVFRVIMLILLPIFPKMVLSFYLILGLYVQVSQPAKCRNCGIPLISHETTCSHCGMPRTVAIDMRFIGIFIVILGITIALSFFPAIGLGKYIQIKIPRYAGSVDDFSQPTPLPPQTPTTNQQNQQSNAQPNVPVTPTPEVPVPQTPPQQEAAPEIVIDDSTKVFFDPSGLNTQYSDSFELGLRWGKFGLGERNRTQDIVNQGEYAVKINGTETGVVFDIGQLLSNTIFVCHMYDGGNMTEQSYCGVSVNQTLALNRTILLGVAQKGSQYYSYFDPFGSLWVTTKVPRKEGWNKLTIETNGILNYLYINDELVGEIDTYTHWRYPFMINYGAGVAYFDDVGVYQRQ
ncbi:MAG TPA: hypothetical protein VK158_01000, partial [Acidobacteriota bacterium]|nr:hypothetical protein [Acidobacteriota bacterium]